MVILGLSNDLVSVEQLSTGHICCFTKTTILGISRNPGIPYEKGSPVRDAPAAAPPTITIWLTG